MNYKLVFPTYRNRWQFVKRVLHQYRSTDGFAQALHLGCGEGDYDAVLAPHCASLYSCDINEADIAFAKKLNSGLPQVSYKIENALALTAKNQSFDMAMSLEVIEHVGQPEKMMEELGRVLQPGALLVMTFPQQAFPLTYDPINLVLSLFGKRRYIPFGAYGYGHDYLIHTPTFRTWAKKYGFDIVEEKALSSYLSGFIELYWPSMLQKVLKPNANNLAGAPATEEKGLRPSLGEPAIARVTDVINGIDSLLFGWTGHSVNKGFVLRKNSLSPTNHVRHRP